MCGGSEAVERKSERMDTAYSPRLHEEELSATASRILLRVVELWLENLRMRGGCVEIVLGFDTKDGWFLLAVAWRLVVSVSG